MSHFRNIDFRMQTLRCHFPRFFAVIVFILMCVHHNSGLAQGDSKPPPDAKNGAIHRVDEKGRKFVNKIPYDVFFDNPLEVVNSNKTSAAPTEALAEKSAEPKPNLAAVSAPSNTNGNAWEEIIPIDELQGEIKTLRNSLTKFTSNQGQFNQNFKLIAIDGAELAALAGIVQEHNEPLSWKERAQFVRDFSSQLNQSAVGLGKENFEKTKSAFQKLTSVLDGSIPADAGEVPAKRPYHEIASRKGLMKRIERAKDWLKQDVNSETKFKSMSDQIRHEAAIISALTTVITTLGYDYTENDDYQNYAESLIEGAKEASAATKDESYEKFKQAVDKVNKSCTDCHGSYGNG